MNKKLLLAAGGIGIALIILFVLFSANTPEVNGPDTLPPPSSGEQLPPGSEEGPAGTPPGAAPQSPGATPPAAPKPAPTPPQPAENPNGPQLTVISPAQGAVLSGPITIEANATDKDSVSKVEFYVNGALISADTYPPYSASYDTLQSNNGKATIIVKAYDRLGNIQQKNLSVSFNNPPTFQSFSLSPQRVNEGEQFTVKWAVSLADSCTASGAWSGAKSSVGSETFMALGTGTYTLTCTGSGGTETKEAALTVTPSLPVLAITAPGSGAIVNGTVTITANAVDNTGISKVEFYFGDTLIATDVTAPYSASYDTTKVADLKYTIRVRAYDRGGNTKEDSISVSTSNGNY